MTKESILIGAIQIVILIVSVVIHEVSHAYSAYKLGDPTAKNLGRLTINPIKHLEWLGSFIVPFSLILLSSPVVFGWAKPVPVNMSYFSRPVKDMAWVALAGPVSNILLALMGLIIWKTVGFQCMLIKYQIIKWKNKEKKIHFCSQTT